MGFIGRENYNFLRWLAAGILCYFNIQLFGRSGVIGQAGDTASFQALIEYKVKLIALLNIGGKVADAAQAKYIPVGFVGGRVGPIGADQSSIYSSFQHPDGVVHTQSFYLQPPFEAVGRRFPGGTPEAGDHYKGQAQDPYYWFHIVCFG
jgi:hypothetical protein